MDFLFSPHGSSASEIVGFLMAAGRQKNLLLQYLTE
jgi:hypothetical protein